MQIPLSVLDTRKKEWQDRNRWWKSHFGIQSELGREDTKSKTRFWDSEGVSIFDAYLTELMYKWFIHPGGKILDPFAGGSVRGIVAEELGFKYTGIELSEKQVKSNLEQSTKPNWLIGDSKKVLPTLTDEFDFIWTCPPYYDLEIYSNNPSDISNMGVDEFDKNYFDILNHSVRLLKPNRFLGIVVSEVREPSITGKYSSGAYRGLVRKTIENLEKCGLIFYNDMVLINPSGHTAKVAGTFFNRNRKIASTHQNVLIFCKGNPDIATEWINNGDSWYCEIKGKLYRSLREAAISINPDKLVASEVERRCLSRKWVHKDWQIIGSETKPLIQCSVNSVPFESPSQLSKVIPIDITEDEARQRIHSTNLKYRNWKVEVPENWEHYSYDDIEKMWETIRCDITLPVISCEGINFTSQIEAANYFGISRERVRQKLNDSKYTDWIRIL